MIQILIGIAAGVIGGMGIGGGTILIPALTFFLNITQQNAQSINLLSFIPAACLAVYIHNKNKSIEKDILFPLIISGVFGAIFGSMVAVNIDSSLLKKIFGLFLFIMGFYEFFSKQKQ
ncbi:MAG TPA: sulfite exporter TauE/SafE family protein [Clostridiales bacterium]|nr:sulfite exporter TauE/SafE family protein [Clostridiales bacterium]